jgi:DNA sulfur modification protein DndB
MNCRNTLFPALRCRMGSTIYYATAMTFGDVEGWIKPTNEIHSSEKLARWIQRQLVKGHASSIADYLTSQNERFFNAIVVGIYGGEPSWAPLRVSSPLGERDFEILDSEHEHLDASFGLLKLSGEEKLFAIDGQHRVAGIKAALKLSPEEVREDEIIALFVGHQTTKAGEQRTRRLFTTLNKTARKVSDADRVALDEDDGFAVVARRLVDDFALFSKRDPIAFSSTASLPPGDHGSVSTIISLYCQLKDFYSPQLTSLKIKKSHFGQARPTDAALDQVYDKACEYWKALKKHVPEVKDVLSGTVEAGEYRKPKKNHLLLRPVGQRAFAGAVGTLVERGDSVSNSVARLSKVDLWIHKKMWHGILWDPQRDVMLKSPSLAETFLLRRVSETGRTSARDSKLDVAIKRLSSHDGTE